MSKAASVISLAAVILFCSLTTTTNTASIKDQPQIKVNTTILKGVNALSVQGTYSYPCRSDYDCEVITDHSYCDYYSGFCYCDWNYVVVYYGTNDERCEFYLTGGEIAGIVIGVLVIVGLIVGGIVFFCRRQNAY